MNALLIFYLWRPPYILWKQQGFIYIKIAYSASLFCVLPISSRVLSLAQVITCNKNSICTLQITDTTGSHQFPAMQRLNISKGHAFIMVYSITSRQSLEELKPTWEIIREIKVRMRHTCASVFLPHVVGTRPAHTYNRTDKRRWCVYTLLMAPPNSLINEAFICITVYWLRCSNLVVSISSYLRSASPNPTLNFILCSCGMFAAGHYYSCCGVVVDLLLGGRQHRNWTTKGLIRERASYARWQQMRRNGIARTYRKGRRGTGASVVFPLYGNFRQDKLQRQRTVPGKWGTALVTYVI